MLLEKFKADVEAFLERTGMTATRFSRETVHNPTFVAHLRAGRAPRLDTADTVYEFMESVGGMPGLSMDEAMGIIKKAQQISDIERGHVDADNALCAFLERLGYGDLAAEYRKVEKWYG